MKTMHAFFCWILTAFFTLGATLSQANDSKNANTPIEFSSSNSYALHENLSLTVKNGDSEKTYEGNLRISQTTGRPLYVARQLVDGRVIETHISFHTMEFPGYWRVQSEAQDGLRLEFVYGEIQGQEKALKIPRVFTLNAITNALEWSEIIDGKLKIETLPGSVALELSSDSSNLQLVIQVVNQRHQSVGEPIRINVSAETPQEHASYSVASATSSDAVLLKLMDQPSSSAPLYFHPTIQDLPTVVVTGSVDTNTADQVRIVQKAKFVGIRINDRFSFGASDGEKDPTQKRPALFWSF